MRPIFFTTFLACATFLPAQQTPTLTMGANLVNLPVVVRDKKGALVQTLTKDDFVLQVDGKPQQIRYFDRDANLPLTLGLLVDTSQSQRSVLDEERTASTAFLDQMLKNKQDKAFIIQFARQTELLQDLTDSKPLLQKGLREIDNTPQRDNNDDPDARRDRGGTVLYDAAFLAADEILTKPKGRKALILLTDGDDRGSKEPLTKAIEAAQRADTTIYAIYFKGEDDHRGGFSRGGGFPGGGGGRGGGGGWPGGGGGGRGGGGGQQGGNRGGEQRTDGKKILTRMTSETGGRLFEVSKKETVANIYQQIAEELRAQYRLGYTPDADHAAEGYHQIDLTLKDTKLKFLIQTRDGYYTTK